ncbi:shikimate kinase [Lentilactobacillus raoultii]|uniref:Shikimate kinase n=1 Tax=Lentilactobacillus raoultii TaxID=1987503 RepID=A0ABW3PQA4_9LACO|nr:shikimate kinase [Lentilactobacillus raoultii]
MRAILVGFMGSGKTTVGRLLANQIQVPYHDLDDVVINRAGKSIQQIFDDEGEAMFRMLEHDALMNSLGDAGILGTGGGTPIQPANFELLCQTTVPVILLDVLPETILTQLKNDHDRPLAKKLGLEGLVELKRQRDDRYRQVSDIRIATDHLTPEQVVNEIRQALSVLN